MLVAPGEDSAVASYAVLTGKNPFGGGGTNKGAYIPLGFNATDERAKKILEMINAAGGAGTYGEGRFTEGIKGMRQLQEEMKAGKISQSDYVRIADQIVPQLYQGVIATGGSGEAAARSVLPFSDQIGELYTNLNLLKQGQDLLGRDMTPQEVARFSPYFQGPNGPQTGPAALAQFAEEESRNPANLGKKAQQYSGQIGGFYQDLLKRGATSEEADYFGRLMATGQVTPYEIQQFIRATPEFQTNVDKEFRSSLSDELAGYDEKAFGRERENILSQYTRAGLQNSSALDFAITEALGKIQEERGQFLGGLSAQQYSGNKAAARGDYEYMRGRQAADRDYGRNRGDQYLDYLTQRADQGTDYARQRNDYLQFLSSQPRQKGGNFLTGALTGAGALAPLGPWGAAIGGGLGALSYLDA